MRTYARFASLFIALAVIAVLSAAVGAAVNERPIDRASEQIQEDEMSVFGPLVKADIKAVKAAISALGKVPKNKDRATKVWAAGITAQDLLIAGFKYSIKEDYKALFDEEKTNYTKDHDMWAGGFAFDTFDSLYDSFFSGGSGNPFEDRYSQRSDAGVTAFLAPGRFNTKFDELNPPFNNSADYVDYTNVYKEMSDKTLAYAKGLLKDNEVQAKMDLIENVSDLTSLSALDADAIKEKLTSPLVVTGLIDYATLSAKQYRAALQIRNRANLFTADQVTKLRLDIAAQIDADAKFAIARQQIRTDRQSAFKRSVGTWSGSTAASAY